MSDLSIVPMNNSFIRVICDSSLSMELSDFFTFEVEGAKFTPAFRAKLWDGKIRLLRQGNILYYGLIDEVISFCKSRDYTYEIDPSLLPEQVITREELLEHIKTLKLHSNGNPIEARDYQIDAALQAINEKRMVILSPTSSGKSLLAYIVATYFLKKKKKILMIVPTIQLVTQMRDDFVDYSSELPVDMRNLIHTITAGAKKNTDKPVVISTWQSIHKEKVDYFKQYDVVIGDECHTYAAKSAQYILESCQSADYRIGLTGTLTGAKTNKMVLTGIFGKVVKMISTRELIDRGQVSDLKITATVLEYPDEDRKIVKNLKYPEEMKFLVHDSRRNAFIAKLAKATKGVTLVMFNYEAHGKKLFEIIKDVSPNKEVFFISGKVGLEERDDIKRYVKSCELNSDVIIVASFGTFSTGISIPNVENIILASPSKAKVRNLQTIGRGLRLKQGKDHCKLFDIGDDLKWKSYQNYTLNHFQIRVKMYMEEQFEFKIVTHKL